MYFKINLVQYKFVMNQSHDIWYKNIYVEQLNEQSLIRLLMCELERWEVQNMWDNTNCVTLYDDEWHIFNLYFEKRKCWDCILLNKTKLV